MSNDLFSKEPSLQPQRATMRTALKLLGLVVGVVVLFIGAQFIGVLVYFIVMLLLGKTPEEVQTALSESIAAQFWATVCVEAVAIGLLWVVLRLKKRSFLTFFGLNKAPVGRDFLFTLLAYIGYFISFLVVVSLVSSLIPSLDIHQQQQLGIDSPVGGELLLVFILLVIFPSIVEELLFRGILFRGLKKYSSLWPAVLLSSLVFGAAHLEFLSDGPLNLIAAIDTTIFGIVLALLYTYRKSLWAPMLLHALKNSIAFVFLFIL